MINYDSSSLPFTLADWTAFLAAIDEASPADESYWIEFKANLDLRNKVERPVLAKAIVAFANRDVARASEYLGGRAVITVGLEPGKVVDVPIDPADLSNWLEPFLGDPAPRWTAQYHRYKDNQVLVVIVDAPKPGDPIYCIARSGGDPDPKKKQSVRAGEIYVRRLGKSELHSPADLQMLMARLTASNDPTVQVDVRASTESGVSLFTASPTWVKDWIAIEEQRLLAPLTPPTPPAGRRISASAAGYQHRLGRNFQSPNNLQPPNRFESRREETRTEAQYREEVATYLSQCRVTLPGALPDLRKALSARVEFTVQNLTEENFRELEIEVHLQGDVEAYAEAEPFAGVDGYRPPPPRTWGPWVKKLFNADFPGARPYLPDGVRPSPRRRGSATRIVNGGGATITFPAINLRPQAPAQLSAGLIVVAGNELTDDIECTWTATATNIRGRTTGSFTIPVAVDRVDLTDSLVHESSRTIETKSDRPTSSQN